MAQFSSHFPLTSAAADPRLAVVALLLLTIPVVASKQQAVGGQQTQVPTNSPGLTIHHADNVIIYQTPSPAPEGPSSLLTLVLCCFCLLLGAFFVHTPWGRYVLQPWEDRTGRMCPVNRRPAGRNLPVSSGAPTAIPALPPADVDQNAKDGRTRASNERGRRSAAATPSGNGAPSHPNELSSRASQASLVEGGEHEPTDTNGLANPNVVELPSPRILSSPVQALPFPLFGPLVELSSALARTRRSSAHATSEQTGTIPIPRPLRGTASQARPRYRSLPHGSGYEPPRSTKAVPLRASLHIGSGNVSRSPVTQCFVLFIAVNTDEKDSERDLRFFREMIRQPTPGPTSIYLESLSGYDATHHGIKAKLESIYLRAGRISDDPLVLVFLTGHADKDNNMCLKNNEVLTEKHLCGWVSDIRTRTNLPNVRSVHIILDICRQNKDAPNATCHVVEFIRSCSLGQRAYALEFDSPSVPSPSSCFLLAFFLAASDFSGSGPSNFKEAFKSRMRQMYQLREYGYHYWHTGSESGRCDQCPEEVDVKCDPPEPQDPEGGQVGWDALADLAALIMAKYPECVRNLAEALIKQIQMCETEEAKNSAPILPSWLLAVYKSKITPLLLLAFWFATRDHLPPVHEL